MNMPRHIKQALLAVGIAALSSISFQARADATINGLFVTGENQIEDTDVERILDSSGAVKTSGDFAVGDTIQTILRFNTVNADIISDTYGTPYQLNAYAELTVASIADLGGGVANIVFAPSGNLGANVFVELYERTAAAQPGFDQTVAPATGISNVQAETLIAELGIGEMDDFWSVTTLLDIAAAAALAPGDSQVANGIFGLSLLSNAGNLPIGPNGILGADGNYHDVVGNASAYQLGPNINDGWLVSSNTTANFVTPEQVPEPAVLALLSLGMLGLGLVRRRRV